MAKIQAPNRGYNGRIGDVVFKDGVAETDNHAVITYCRGAGYTVDDQEPETPETEEPADPREVTTEMVGGPLRDAAVDPQPGDFLPPTNAGQANPHGPAVVAPGVHAAPPAPIVPGPVLDDADAQAARETEAAERVLAGDELVPDVTADMAGAKGTVPAEAEPPAGNATTEEWRTYAVEHRGATTEQVADMKRDELRAKYGPTAE